MKRVAIYMRVSSDRQAKEGDSIPAQREALTKYINDHPDMTLAGEYLDDGISGTKEDRDELNRMLSDVKDGKIDQIIVTKLDRLYRSIRHYLNMQELLDKYNVPWLAIWEPIYDTSTPQGRLIINQMMSIAQFEAENTGQRIRQVQAYKVNQGEVISGSVPPGYKIVEKRMIPTKDAEAVKEMFEYYAFTGSINETMCKFDHLGIFPRSKPAFKAILRNRKYTGAFRGNPNFCEPIIGKDLFEDVQRKLSINVKSSQKETYLFSGILKCAECGNSMGAGTRRMNVGRPVHIHRYRCSKRYNNGPKQCSNCKCVNENVLERYLLENIRPMVQNYIVKINAAQTPVKSNQARISNIEKKISKLKDLYINDLISLDEYKKDKESMQRELDELKAVTAPQRKNISLYEDFLTKDIESLYTGFSASEKRYFWRSIIKEIRFGIDKKFQIIFL